MGKPSRTRSQSSNTSQTSNTSKHSRNTIKRTKSFKKLRRKQKKTIQKLFENLRNSTSVSDEEQDNTVIILDDTIQENPKSTKRKAEEDICNKSKISKSGNVNVIVIKDNDDLEINNNPCPSTSHTPKRNKSLLHSSTPINKQEKLSQVFDLSNISSSNPKADKSPNYSRELKNIDTEIVNLTKDINPDSFLTIDLTTETLNATNNTVIDLVNNSEIQDCSVSNSNLSLSGESDVTVLNRSQYNKTKERKFQKFLNGISEMNANDKGKLLELITKKIFNGCNIPSCNSSISSVKQRVNKSVDTAEDAFIKEVILGQTQSRNSIGSNIYNPAKEIKNKSGLRMVVIDGSNVAMGHGQHNVFSVKGLKICIDYFVKRGHIVKAFVPRFRCKMNKSSDPRLLDELERLGLVIYTPSREIQGPSYRRFITSYDDRYIVQCAAEFDGVIVSGDNYKDLMKENPRWRSVIENRLLPFTWVNDMIMFPKDPLGRHGPSLETFLKH